MHICTGCIYIKETLLMKGNQELNLFSIGWMHNRRSRFAKTKSIQTIIMFSQTLFTYHRPFHHYYIRLSYVMFLDYHASTFKTRQISFFFQRMVYILQLLTKWNRSEEKRAVWTVKVAEPCASFIRASGTNAGMVEGVL